MAEPSAAPKLLVLPSTPTDNAKILTLKHPRTSKPSRYYFDPTHGIYEFTRIAAPKAACRSWLLETQPEIQRKRRRGTDEVASAPIESSKAVKDGVEGLSAATDQHENNVSGDYVVRNAELLVATAMDPAFLCIPALVNQKLFLSADDLLDQLSEDSQHFTKIICNQLIRQQIVARLGCICDIVIAGSEEMYRLSEEKLLAELLRKAERMVASALPPSIEERFIRRSLETPLAALQCEDSCSAANGSVTPMSEAKISQSDESQTSTATASSISTNASDETQLTIPDDTDVKDSPNLHHLLRVRASLDFMIASYLPPSLSATIKARLTSDQSPVDFKPADDRLAEIAKLRADAVAARSLGDFSHKRNLHEEDDAAESRVEKKRRKEEEEKKKKAGETRGVRDLKKVDTKGMKKMSDFFGRRVSPRKKGQ